MRWVPVFLMLILTVGCASPTNPSFNIASADAEKAIDAMAQSPRRLERPIVIIDGFLDPGLGARYLSRRLHKLVNDDRIVTVQVADCLTFDGCRQRVVAAVDEAFPTSDPNFTAEVDVIGFSMGGLAARYAAAALEPEEGATTVPSNLKRRLRIARLFTFASPMTGANLAGIIPGLLPTHRDMAPDSEFMRRMNAERPGYEIVSYVRLGDELVGAAHAAPAGQTVHWVANEPFQSAHFLCVTDPRLIADLLRRLRDEAPFATEPAAALPG